MAGKLSVKGCNTPQEEEKELLKIAKKTVKNRKIDENTKDLVRVKILKGFILVKKAKYLADKEYYDGLEKQLNYGKNK